MDIKVFKDMKKMLSIKKIMYPLYLISCVIINYLNGEDVFSTFTAILNQFLGINSPWLVLTIYLMYYYVLWAILTMIVLALILYIIIRFINFLQSIKNT